MKKFYVSLLKYLEVLKELKDRCPFSLKTSLKIHPPPGVVVRGMSVAGSGQMTKILAISK